jgi:hypothetical protein
MAEPTDRRCSSVKFANLCRPLLLIAAVAIAAAIVAAVTPAPAQDAAAIPDPQVTPGAVTSTDRITACAQGHTRRPPLIDVERNVLKATV